MLCGGECLANHKPDLAVRVNSALAARWSRGFSIISGQAFAVLRRRAAFETAERIDHLRSETQLSGERLPRLACR